MSAWVRQPTIVSNNNNNSTNTNATVTSIAAAAPLAFKQIVEQERQHRKLVREEEDVDADLKLAMQLSLLESQTAVSNDNTAPSSVPPDIAPDSSNDPVVDEHDVDYMLALQLQHQFEVENQHSHISQQRARQIMTGFSKVDTVISPKAQTLLQVNRIAANSDLKRFDDGSLTIVNEDEDDDEYDEEAELERERDELAQDPNKLADQFRARLSTVKPHHEAVKSTGRVAASEFITKHDAIMEGVRNSASLEGLVNSGSMQNYLISGRVYNSLKEESRRDNAHKTRVRGNRVDKHTNEQVLDEKTRVLVLKMINNGFLKEMNGVVSTGKEANVYHAISGTSKAEYAMKIYKTTLNEFRNRTDYLEGEYRFRKSRASFHNPRKLIRMWAEKEMRNLKRLRAVGVRVPNPVALKDNVLVMDFVGENGVKAPSLRELNITTERWNQLYRDVSLLMRRIYQDGRLVHGDFSEFNLLFAYGNVIVIDVSQAVEHDHPKAMEFLRNDCTAITNFFTRRGVRTLTVRELFEFVTDVVNLPAGVTRTTRTQVAKEIKTTMLQNDVTDVEDDQEDQFDDEDDDYEGDANETENESDEDDDELVMIDPSVVDEAVDTELSRRRSENDAIVSAALEKLLAVASTRTLTSEQLSDHEHFMRSYIPRTLKQVRDVYGDDNDGQLLHVVTGTPEKKSSGSKNTTPASSPSSSGTLNTARKSSKSDTIPLKF